MRYMEVDGVRFKVPKWADASAKFYVFAGQEVFAILTRCADGVHVEVKEDRCSLCGDCCDPPFKEWDKDGRCKYLEENGGCRLGSVRPFSCAVHIPSGLEICTLKFREIGVIKE